MAQLIDAGVELSEFAHLAELFGQLNELVVGHEENLNWQKADLAGKTNELIGPQVEKGERGQISYRLRHTLHRVLVEEELLQEDEGRHVLGKLAESIA